eukprot:scaffold36432_cov32-Prasinocladus_malaysianus.AAC.1
MALPTNQSTCRDDTWLESSATGHSGKIICWTGQLKSSSQYTSRLSANDCSLGLACSLLRGVMSAIC